MKGIRMQAARSFWGKHRREGWAGWWELVTRGNESDVNHGLHGWKRIKGFCECEFWREREISFLATKEHKRDKEERYGEIGGDWETKAIH
jgi:hypothetical protein